MNSYLSINDFGKALLEPVDYQGIWLIILPVSCSKLVIRKQNLVWFHTDWYSTVNYIVIVGEPMLNVEIE